MDKRITIYVDDGRYQEIVKIAQKEDRSISNMIDNIFKHYIEFYYSNVNKKEV
jgi:predicted CopG family antitoxin